MGGIPVFAAILIGLASSFVQSLGLTIQRKSHLQNDLLPPSSRGPAIRRPLWLVGFTIYITSNLFSTIFQLDALPIVILAPLGAVSLVFNALLARVLLGDKFGASWILGTGLVAGGAVTIAIFGVVPDVEHGLDELLVLLKRPTFVAFFSIALVATCAVLAVAHIATWHVQKHSKGQAIATPISVPPSNYASPRSPAPIPFRPTYGRQWSDDVHVGNEDNAVSYLSNRNGFKTPLLTKTRQPSPLSIPDSYPEESPKPKPCDTQAHTLTLCGLAFAASSGTLSGLTLVLAKAFVELSMKTIDHWRTGEGQNELARFQTWVLLGGIIVIALAQIWYLNFSLRYAGPALVCPLAFCFFNLSSIFDGLVFYDQFSQLSTSQILLVSLGTAILLTGVWVVSAIKPEGGVELGTWVENGSETSSVSSNEDDEIEGGEGSTLLGGETTLEPENNQDHSYPQPHPQTSIGPPTPPSRYHPTFASSPSSPSSPSPASPRVRHSSQSSFHHHYRRGPRYGTLIPDLAPPGAPTGFSIGLGAASPGFALRHGHMGEHHHLHHGHSHSHMSGENEGRNRRSRSEGPLGLSAIMRGEDLLADQETRGERDDNDAEVALRDWDGREGTRRWWDIRRLFSSEGKIWLEDS